MYVAVEHKIDDPSTFWSSAREMVPKLPSGIELHHCHPAPDGSRGICVWEVESVEKLRTFLDGKVGHVSQNDYYQVENKDAVALPTGV